MTFNLLVANPNSSHPWPERRPGVSACIRELAPDLIGTQEGLYTQITELAGDCPAYDWIGLGRSGGSRGELMAIFYLRDRFELLGYDHFWLSDTPQSIGSATWGNTAVRMVTWGKFRDRQCNREFYFWNTHLDHAVQPAREKAAELIAQRVNELETKLPIILVGDFNAAARQNPAYDILTGPGGFADTWVTAERHIGPDLATYHGYQLPVADGGHIDWVLTRGLVQTQETAVVTFQHDNQYPSDHFPVIAHLNFTDEGGASPT